MLGGYQFRAAQVLEPFGIAQRPDNDSLAVRFYALLVDVKPSRGGCGVEAREHPVLGSIAGEVPVPLAEFEGVHNSPNLVRRIWLVNTVVTLG